MKKFASLSIVLILVLCLATTAFAAEPQVYDVYNPMMMPTNITLAGGEEATINIMANGLSGKTLRVTGDNAIITVANMMGSTTKGPDSVVEGVMQIAMYCTVTVKNGGTESADYALEVVIPLGEMSNPDTLEIGENVTEIAEGGQGYFYTWTAPAAGKLTVTMPADGWVYCVNNTTTGIYGDQHWYDDDPVVNPTVIDVAAGDEIQIMVNTYDSMTPWTAPAGTLSVNAMFECKEHAAVKVDAVEAGCHNIGNIEHWYCATCNGYWTNAELTGVTNAMRVVSPATGAENVEHIEAVEAGCHNNGNIEHLVCGGCDGLFADEACTQEILPALRATIPATGAENVTHVEATTPACHRNGMQEHWICGGCNGYFTDAECTHQVMQPRQLIIPAEVALEYHAEVPATCVENGMQEYWYCAKCDAFFTDAEGIFNIASKSLTILADGTDHVLEMHEAVEPGCHRNGNVAYSYCAECDCYFIEVEGNLVNTNSKNVVLLAKNELEHHKAVAATCTKDGMQEYWYCAECDCFFTDAEGIFNIASKRLVIPATGHNIVDGKCTICNDNPKTGDAGILAPAFAALVSAMSMVALVVKKKEF